MVVLDRWEDKEDNRPAIDPVRCNRCRSVALYVAVKSQWGCASDRFVSPVHSPGNRLGRFCGAPDCTSELHYCPAIDLFIQPEVGMESVGSWCFASLGRPVGRTG